MNANRLALELDLDNGTRLSVNMPIERQCWTFYYMVIVMFALYVTVYEIFAVELCLTLT